MSGLDLNEFLTSNTSGSGSGGRGNWLEDWGKRNPPTITVWLHPGAKIYPVWGHKFIEVGEKKVDGQDKKVPCLRFPNYVCMDQREVYENQRFRDNGILKVLPNLDPFIYLREWLRWCCDRSLISDNAVVFEWTDYGRNDALIQWTAGRISGRVKGNNFNWSHHVDAKLEFLFTVLDADALQGGAKITRETQLVGEQTQKLMKQQMEAKGLEAGNPLLNPYPIRWKYNDQAKSFGEKYETFRIEQEVYGYTTAVYEAFQKEFPDAEPFSKPGDGDLVKIQAAMKAAQQIALPLELIFSEDLATRRSVLRGTGAPGSSSASSQSTRVDSSAVQTGAVRPPAQPGAPRPTSAIPPPPAAAVAPAPTRSVAPPAAAPAASAGGGGRRRIAAPPEPHPVEQLPCEKCNTMFPANATQCPKCGQKYDVDPGLPPPPAAAAPVSTPAPAAVTGNAEYCEICGQYSGFAKVQTDSGVVEKCNNCKAEKSDDIPFHAAPRMLSSHLRRC